AARQVRQSARDSALVPSGRLVEEIMHAHGYGRPTPVAVLLRLHCELKVDHCVGLGNVSLVGASGWHQPQVREGLVRFFRVCAGGPVLGTRFLFVWFLAAMAADILAAEVGADHESRNQAGVTWS